MAYQNGKLPSSALVRAYKNATRRLRKGKPATAFMRLSQRSHAKGYGYIKLADAYRDYAGQLKAWAAYKAGRGALAARPGTSNHGMGISIDAREPYASDGPKHRWFEKRLAFYGWYWEGRDFTQREYWHYTFRYFPARPLLRPGSTGDAVVAWQCVLRYDLGIPARKMRIDGIDGRITTSYTKKWQKKHKLKQDGIIGPKTWRAAGLA